jgi:hypothetical protein
MKQFRESINCCEGLNRLLLRQMYSYQSKLSGWALLSLQLAMIGAMFARQSEPVICVVHRA